MKTLKHNLKKTFQQQWLSGKSSSVPGVFLIVVLMGMIWACQVEPGNKNRRGGTEASHDFASDWPVLRNYDADHVDRIALPLGGIGTGTVSLGGRGNLRDWEIMNRPAKGYNPGPRFEIAPFFVLYTEQQNSRDTRILEGPVPLYEYEGSRGVDRITNHGMPRFEESTFDAAYPFGQVNLSHPELPVRVRIKGFNPLVPGDARKSGIPIAALEFELMNTSNDELDAAICFSMQNFIGDDGNFGVTSEGMNKYRANDKLRGIFLQSDGVDHDAEQWGSIAVTTTSDENVTYRTNWKKQHWGSSLLDFWDDFSEDGMLEERPATGEDRPMASVATKVKLSPGEKKEVKFFITWHFPNRMAWSESMLQNYYTKDFHDAWDVAEKTLPDLESLEEQTVEFVNAFIGTDLPDVVKEAALFNLSTLRTQTCFRTEDGYYFTWEGCNDETGCCFGSCTHVWNYEHATGYLFGELARKKRETEFGLTTSDIGLMSFRVSLPLERAQSFQRAAADGQMGSIMKMYRDWQLSGDDEMLDRLYPNVVKALQFCWIPGGWDADMDGVMEGVQHNTMDVEYYGPNPQMGIWYLGALRAMEEMAGYKGDSDLAAQCQRLFKNGSKWLDENLFNGEYYIHKIQLPENMDAIHSSLVVGMGGDNRLEPDYQLGEGCLVDQLVGQYVAHILGLGYLVDPGHLTTTLGSIMKYNYRADLRDHFNCFRSYALGNEAALLMASYPKSRPANPFPYFTEVMTGFEYTAAVGMLYEGLKEDGLRCIRNIRDRYDGFKRNPFDEAECGHHYGRAMASWSAVLALTGFHYSAVNKSMSFNATEGKHFWSNGYQYGTVEIKDKSKKKSIRLTTINDELTLNSFSLNGFGSTKFDESIIVIPGQTVNFEIEKD
jgi:non-lysosomal glucosylceramidase